MDRKKVAIMTRMAFYEQGDGPEDRRVCQYYKKDYASLHMWYSLIWLTVGYVLLVGALFFAFSDQLFNHTQLQFYIKAGAGIVIVYLLLLLIYGIASRSLYSNRHKMCRSRLKGFMRDVIRLEKIYERGQGV
ncbi:MAG: hypothetical protein II787_04470 [Lachnospiraceae bacterium]|nr:hypothetical protein [Lachnospiraceae bacterium]